MSREKSSMSEALLQPFQRLVASRADREPVSFRGHASPGGREIPGAWSAVEEAGIVALYQRGGIGTGSLSGRSRRRIHGG